MNFFQKALKMIRKQFNNGGIVAETQFINEQQLQKNEREQLIYISQKYNKQYRKDISNFHHSLSPFNESQSSRFSKQDFDTAKKTLTRTSLSSDNQQDQDELVRNTVHQVEIDSEGFISEKTYQQVYNQFKNNEINRLEYQNQYNKSSLIKVEETYVDNSKKDSQKQSKKQEDRYHNKQQNCQLNQSYVSFDDSGENFTTLQLDDQSEFYTKQSNKIYRFSSASSSCTAIYQKKIDEIQQELKEKISFLITLEEELLETKTQLNMQKLDNSSLKERINKLQKDNSLMQKQINQSGETIKNLEKATNSLVNQILLKNTNEVNKTKDGNQISENNFDANNTFTTYQDYLNDIVKSNINLRCNLEELYQKYSQLRNQIHTSVNTNSSPISARINNTILDSTNNTSNHKNNLLRSTYENRSSLSPQKIHGQFKRTQSPIQGGLSIEDYEMSLNQSQQNTQAGYLNKFKEIKQSSDKFVSQYLKNKIFCCNDEQEKLFYDEMENQFEQINDNLLSMELYIEETKFENEIRIKNAREQFEITLKEIEQIKKIAEERNKILTEQVKQIEQENSYLNKTIQRQKDILEDNEKSLDESKHKLQQFQQSSEQYQTMIKQANENLIAKSDEVKQLKQNRERLEQDLNDKNIQIKELKSKVNQNNQFIRQLQETIIDLQKDIQEKQVVFSKEQECLRHLKDENEKTIQDYQQDAIQIQQKENEYLEREIKMRDTENLLLNEISQRDQMILNLQEQINQVNSSDVTNRAEYENKNLKSELNSMKQIKMEFENNFLSLQNQIKTLKTENKQLKNNDIDRKLQNYDKYIKIEVKKQIKNNFINFYCLKQKLGLQQIDLLLLIEKLPLAEQELQIIVGLNEKLQEELNNVIFENQDFEKQLIEWKNKYDMLNLELNTINEQFNQEREILKENIEQQIIMNQQLQKQNLTIAQNCKINESEFSALKNQNQSLLEENQIINQKCTKLENFMCLLMKERDIMKKISQENQTSQTEQNMIKQNYQNIQTTRERQTNNRFGKQQETYTLCSSSKMNDSNLQLNQQISPNYQCLDQFDQQSLGMGKQLSSSASYENLKNSNFKNKYNNQTNQIINTSPGEIYNRQFSNNSRNQDSSISISPHRYKQVQTQHSQQQQYSPLSPIPQNKHIFTQSQNQFLINQNLIKESQNVSPLNQYQQKKQIKENYKQNKYKNEQENQKQKEQSINIQKFIEDKHEKYRQDYF